jgi:hypothetical protein
VKVVNVEPGPNAPIPTLIVLPNAFDAESPEEASYARTTIDALEFNHSCGDCRVAACSPSLHPAAEVILLAAGSICCPRGAPDSQSGRPPRG